MTPGLESELAYVRSALEQRPLTAAQLVELTQRMFALTARALGRPESSWELAKSVPALLAGRYTLTPTIL